MLLLLLLEQLLDQVAVVLRVRVFRIDRQRLFVGFESRFECTLARQCIAEIVATAGVFAVGKSRCAVRVIL